MKKRRTVIIVVAIVLVAALAGGIFLVVERSGPMPEVHHPYVRVDADNTTPSGAIVGLLTALRDWDLGIAAQWMGDMPVSPFTEAYHSALAPALSRMEFDIGAEKIMGRTAMVDVSITSVDFGVAFGDITTKAAAYLLTSALDHDEPDWSEFLASYLSELNPDEMIRVKRQATAFLIQDSGGKWRLDTQNSDNRDFYNAITGGLVSTMEALKQVAALSSGSESLAVTV